MPDKLLSSVSPLSLKERRDYYQVDAFFNEEAVYIALLSLDDPLRQQIPKNQPNPDILYVLRDLAGKPIGVSDDKVHLTYRAAQNDKVLYTLH